MNEMKPDTQRDVLMNALAGQSRDRVVQVLLAHAMRLPADKSIPAKLSLEIAYDLAASQTAELRKERDELKARLSKLEAEVEPAINDEQVIQVVGPIIRKTYGDTAELGHYKIAKECCPKCGANTKPVAPGGQQEGWISVKERLPLEVPKSGYSQQKFQIYPSLGTYVAEFTIFHDGDYDWRVPHISDSVKDEITHWQPLPAPPSQPGEGKE